MKIKDYICKCGNDDFFMKANGNQTGIYCKKCGKWYKWANKDELNLMINVPDKETYTISSEDFDMLANLYWSLRLNGNHERADDLAALLKRLDPERCKPQNR